MNSSDQIVDGLLRAAVQASEDSSAPLANDVHERLAEIKEHLDEPVDYSDERPSIKAPNSP